MSSAPVSRRRELLAVVLLVVLAGSVQAQLEKLRTLQAGESLQIGDVLFTMHQKNAGVPDDDGWYPAVSKGGKFRISFPGPFTDFTSLAPAEDGAQVRTHVVGAGTLEGATLTATCTQRSDGTISSNWMDGVLDGFRERTEKVATQRLTRDRLSGLSVRVEDGESVVLAQLLTGRNETCQLVVEHPVSEDDYMPQLAQMFFASFVPSRDESPEK